MPKRNGAVERVCQQCSKPFKTWPYLVEKGYGITCSRACAAKKYPAGYQHCPTCKRLLPETTEYFHRNKGSGRKNKLHSQCKQCIRNINGFSRVKRLYFILSRDSRCEKCGVYSEEPRFFDIDHIIPKFKSGSRKHQYNYGDGSEYQLLCPNCHRFKTIEDLKEWDGYYSS